MAYKTVEVEVDFDEFSTGELVDELLNRITAQGRIKLSESQKKELCDSIKPLFEELSPLAESGIEINTIDDEMKREHIAKVWNKYTPIQFEQLMP